MPKRYLSRLVPLPVRALLGAAILAALPVEAELFLDKDTGSFTGDPGYLMVHGTIEDLIVHVALDPVIGPDPDGDYELIKLTLRTTPSAGRREPFAYKIEVPELKSTMRLVVESVTFNTGIRQELFDQTIAIEPEAELTLSKTVLLPNETLTAGAKLYSSPGTGFAGTFERVGDRIRVPLHIGCIWCPDSPDIQYFDLNSGPIGPFPPGEYTLELVEPDGIDDFVYLTEKITVLPEPAALQDGRFTVEVPLDLPPGRARLVGLPSRDSALFYFFSRANWELMVKVLDGCAINGHYWVFGAASTDVGYTVVVRDLAAAQTREYRHPAGTPAPAITDITAFPCAAAGAAEGAYR